MGKPRLDFNAFTASHTAIEARKDYLSGKYTMRQLCDKYDLTSHYVNRLVDFFGDDVTIPRDKPGRKTHLVRNHHIENWLDKGRSVEYIANQLELPTRQVLRSIEKYELGSPKLRARLLGTENAKPRRQQNVPRNGTIKKLAKDLTALEEAVTGRALVPVKVEAPDIPERRVVPLEKRMDGKVVKRLNAMYRRQREDVRADGEKFRVKFEDIDFPTHCPIRGVALDYTAIVRSNKRGRRKENAPVFDLRDPTKGWVKGNVCVLSWRASRIKGAGSAEDHLRIARFMAGQAMDVSTEGEAAPNEIRLTIGMDQEASITIRNRT